MRDFIQIIFCAKLYNSFSKRALLQRVFLRSTAKIFRFFKKTIVVQILLFMYSTIVNNNKKVIRIVFPNGCRLTITALLMKIIQNFNLTCGERHFFLFK